MKCFKRIAVLLFLLLYLISQNTTIFAFSFYTEDSDRLLTGKINAGAAVLIDEDTAEILYDKNSTAKKYPASLTKIMTALLILEQTEIDYEKKITVNGDLLKTLDPDSSVMGLKPDERVTVNELLYGLMLSSGNDAAVVLADYFAGSVTVFGTENILANVDEFCRRMTQRAKELNALSTNFTNPHGLFDENHYSTAYDMALILREAVKLPKFVELISAKTYMLQPNEVREKERELKNTDRLIQEGEHYNENVIGGKTGFLSESKHNLASYAVKDGLSVIAVVMEEEGMNSYTDSNTLYGYAFNNLEYMTIFDKDIYGTVVNVMGIYEEREAVFGQASLFAKESLTLLMPKSISYGDLSFTADTSGFAADKIAAEDRIGKVIVSYNGEELGSTELYSANSVDIDDFYRQLALEETRLEAWQQESVPAFAISLPERDMLTYISETNTKTLFMLGCLACVLGVYAVIRFLYISRNR